MCHICRRSVAAGMLCLCLQRAFVTTHHDPQLPGCQQIDSADRCQIAQVMPGPDEPDEKAKGPVGWLPSLAAAIQTTTGTTGGTFWQVPST